jgi:copper transporter 1
MLAASSTAAVISASSSADHGKDGTTLTARGVSSAPIVFRPNVFQQAIRALIHMCAFAVAYFVML